ncbi:RDD family protein [Clavibacter michiganensis subsp. michiganensis]|uniref:RDD family protein n=1 Tax=Clavibacter michiganensis TaxID=28447 RepID=UPI000B6AB010|nr:RDD family protein [Clavibacter michiganensis]KAF0258636.1 RDD family protein [Clavibacter michiganensis subsp. michiganensis]MBE3078048.1 RDD family protein [Clavibacter michiganensis subsp. michiganensis]MBW8027266.1 RDD family protein [Clavibacter michiganensis subsp. michiganensis]MWJ17719.1 RDD family protein [Clavibacter michiganensis subsp. michiganensis]OUD98026.1 RDD family protein [Clavibacter michiganensis subsp. michiganensis]
MTRHPGDRLIAVLIDWLFMCVWIGLVAAVTVPLFLIGATASLAPVAENAVAALVTVVPITIALAVMESGPRQSTPGKRARRLVVRDARTGDALPFRRALLRNAVKVALPWAVGHAAVYAIVGTSGTTGGTRTSVPAGVEALTAIAYVLPAVWLVTLLLGSGRTPYDRIAGAVVARPAPRA